MEGAHHDQSQSRAGVGTLLSDRPRYSRRCRAVVDVAMASASAVLRSPAGSMVRRGSDPARRSGVGRNLRPICAARPRHASAVGANATSGDHRRNRYVRNPIYLALVAIALGQGLILGDARLLVYGALLWIGFHIFVLAYEEPTLRGTFGAEYEAYCATVPRWLPRFRPSQPARA